MTSLLANFLLAALFVDCDFSAHDPGIVRNRVAPGDTVGFVRTEDCYGRRLGDAQELNLRLGYPRYAVGRDGSVSAVWSGTALDGVPGSVPDPIMLPGRAVLPREGTSTFVLWFFVSNPVEQDASVRLCESQFGYRVGFRLDWQRARWSPQGCVGLVYGDGKGSRSIMSYAKPGEEPFDVRPGQWHQVAVVADGKTLVLYVDGVFRGQNEGKYLARQTDEGSFVPLTLRLGSASNRACFKTDAFRLYDTALKADEIAADWQAGRCRDTATPSGADEQAALAALPRLRPNRHGLYCRGDRVDVVAGEKVLKTVRLDKTGLQDLTCLGYRFPLAVFPRKPRTDDLGAVNLLNRQPELVSLGIRRSLAELDWSRIEFERNSYDWTSVDRVYEAGEKMGVKTFFAIVREPEWYRRNPAGEAAQAEKFRRLVAARYGARPLGEDEFAVVDMRRPADIAPTLARLRREGARKIFLGECRPVRSEALLNLP